MTHAEHLLALERAVVEAARAYRNNWLTVERPSRGKPAYAVIDAVDALIAAEAATCGKCGGAGKRPQDTGNEFMAVAMLKCPDCGGTGRKK